MAITADDLSLTLTHSQSSDHFRAEVHCGQETVVYSKWIWEVGREGELQELEDEHSVYEYPTGKTYKGLLKRDF